MDANLFGSDKLDSGDHLPGVKGAALFFGNAMPGISGGPIFEDGRVIALVNAGNFLGPSTAGRMLKDTYLCKR